MKITPLEIRQKTFEKNLRGYDKDEVNAFMTTMSQEWEKILEELKDARIKLESAEKEVAKLREVETTLYKTLKTAEETGNNIMEQANRAAGLQIREAQLQAEGLIYESRNKAKSIVEDSEITAQKIFDELEAKMKEMIIEFRGLMQHKDHFSSDLIRMAGELNDRAERAKKLNEGFNPEQFLARVKKEIFSTSEEPKRAEIFPEKPTAHEKSQGSFFDEIG